MRRSSIKIAFLHRIGELLCRFHVVIGCHLMLHAGEIYHKIGKIWVARSIYNNILEFIKVDRYRELNTTAVSSYIMSLIALGTVERDIGHPRQAESLFYQALRMAENARYPIGVMEAMRSLAFLRIKLGDLTGARDALKLARAMEEQVSDKQIRANLWAALGNYYYEVGDIEKSIECYGIGYQYATESNFYWRKATLLSDLAIVYQNVMGDLQKSADYLERARIEARKAGYTSSKVYTTILRRLGGIQYKLGKYEQSYIFYKESYIIARNIGLRPEQGYGLLGMGKMQWLKGEVQLAQQTLSQAKSVFTEIGYIREVAMTLEVEGDIASEEGLFGKAVQAYHRAVIEYDKLLFLEKIWEVYMKLGDVYVKQGKFGDAYESYERAIDNVEQLRAYLYDETKRQMAFAYMLAAYKRMIRLNLSFLKANIRDLCIKPEVRIYEYVEKIKARTIVDKLGDTSLQFLDELDQSLYSRYLELRSRQISLMREIQADSRPNHELVASYRALDAEAWEITEILAQKYPKYATLRQARIVPLAKVQGSIGDGDVALDYLLLDDMLLVIVISKTEVVVRATEISRTELRDLVSEYLYEIVTPANILINEPINVIIARSLSRLEVYGHSLSKVLFEPIKQWAAQARVLLISPSGFLYNFPFHTLPLEGEGGNFLGGHMEMVYAPSITVWYLCQFAPDTGKRLFVGFEGFYKDGDLPYVKGEVEEISQMFDRYLNFMDQEATKENFIKNATRGDVVHIAGHGEFVDNNPMQSKLYLSPASALVVQDVLNVSLDGCDLVTLNTCESGISQVRKGDETVGFVRAFLYAGASSVLVSLWSVEDYASREMVREFYKRYTQGMRKSRALRLAWQSLANQYDYRHPFFWGGLILVGSYANSRRQGMDVKEVWGQAVNVDT